MCPAHNGCAAVCGCPGGCAGWVCFSGLCTGHTGGRYTRQIHGIAIDAVKNSHHSGAAAYHLEPVAEAGLVGLAFGNSPAAMLAAGGRRAIFGTKPIAAAFPRRGLAPVVVDLSLSEVAHQTDGGSKKRDAILSGWARDAQGQPTTDAYAGLPCSTLPFGPAQGGSTGAMLALIVELLVTCLSW